MVMLRGYVGVNQGIWRNAGQCRFRGIQGLGFLKGFYGFVRGGFSRKGPWNPRDALGFYWLAVKDLT